MRTVREQGGDVFVFVRKQETLWQSCGLSRLTNFQRLEKINEEADVKCLLLDVSDIPLLPPAIEIRVSPQQLIAPASVFVYGNKYAFLIPEGHQDFLVHAFNIVTVALGYREQFLSVWNKAMPILARAENLRSARTAG